MSYWHRELSADRSDPAELYEFLVYGGGQLEQALRYTPAQTPIQHQGEIYAPLAITRDAVQLGGEIERIQFRLRVPIGSPPARLFVDLYSSHVIVRLRIWRLQPTGWLLFWTGRITGAAMEDETVVLRADPFAGVLQREGLRGRYQTGCRHLLFGPGCGLQRDQWTTQVTVTFVPTPSYVQPGDQYFFEFETSHPPSGWPGGYLVGDPIWGEYWAMGYAVCPGKGRAMINWSELIELTGSGTYTGGVLAVRPIPGLAVGDVVTLVPGCNKTLQHCADKFANLANYGGFPWIPAKNPFAGDPIV